MKSYTTKVEEPMVSIIVTFLANDNFVEGEEESGLNRTYSLSWRGHHEVIAGQIGVAGGVKRAIDVELYNFRQDNIEIMCAIILQGGNWAAVAKMQQEVEDFICKVIFTVGNAC